MIKRLFTALLPCGLLLIMSCAGAGLMPNPPKGKRSERIESVWVDEAFAGRAVGTLDVDFAKAFEETPTPRDTFSDTVVSQAATVTHSLRYPSFKVPKRRVKVMIRPDLKETSVNSGSIVLVRSPKSLVTFKGSMDIESDIIGDGGFVIATVNKVRKELYLPCTLYASSGVRNKTELLTVGENGYRGMLIIVRGNGNAFSIINWIDVEDYLRGVVPLEIGNLNESEIEAMKAQAVAARTYTYKRMASGSGKAFDLQSTTVDQVYGGVDAETETADAAVLMTKDLIMGYDNEIVNAYYHSTCGGKTAGIEDVWAGSESFPYLRSIDDVDSRGKAYCGVSSSFTWTETWSESLLSSIIKRYSPDGKLEPPFKGSLRKMEIRERFSCGRVKKLAVISSGGHEHLTGGDKTRFLLRRNIPSRQILRSANIKSINFSNGNVTISGGGYGHGIGMCQVGAIGRAREGRSFDEILKAYYSGVMIRTAIDDGR